MQNNDIFNTESDKCILSIRFGVMKVYAKSKPILKETKSKLLAALSKMPLFAATFRENNIWNLDIDAGMQRWNGTKNIRELCKALRHCQFSEKDIKKAISICKKNPMDYCPREY